MRLKVWVTKVRTASEAGGGVFLVLAASLARIME